VNAAAASSVDRLCHCLEVRTGSHAWTNGGGAAPTRKEDEPMDGEGARELARLLEERNGQTTPVHPPKPLLNTAAAPIFHWFGIEPPGVAPDERVDDSTPAG
jgi:hypothetical protein